MRIFPHSMLMLFERGFLHSRTNELSICPPGFVIWMEGNLQSPTHPREKCSVTQLLISPYNTSEETHKSPTIGTFGRSAYRVPVSKRSCATLYEFSTTMCFPSAWRCMISPAGYFYHKQAQADLQPNRQNAPKVFLHSVYWSHGECAGICLAFPIKKLGSGPGGYGNPPSLSLLVLRKR